VHLHSITNVRITTIPRIVPKVVRDKKLATTTNDDVTSPLSRKLLAALSSVDMNVSPQKQVVTDHTGDQFPHIRLMTVVENYPLMTGHTFA